MKSSEWVRRIGLIVALFEKIGLWGALHLIIRNYAFRTSRVIDVHVKGIPHPLKPRTRTTDFHAFSQVIALCDYYFGVWRQSASVASAYQAAVNEGRQPLILDCGANIGLASVWFACAYPQAQIIAVEASRENFNILELNVSKYPNITPIHGAIWNNNEEVSISNPDAEPWAFQIQEKPISKFSNRKMYGIMISDILKKYGSNKALIIKIDIEGGESYLFKSSTEWVAQTELLILELHDDIIPFHRVSRNFYQCLAGIDAEVCMKGENIFVFVAPPFAAEGCESLSPMESVKNGGVGV